MPTPVQTKPGQRKLSEVARHIQRPSGIVTTGWPAVRDRLAQFGIPFDVWQEGAGRLILAKRSDGLYAAGVGGVVISIPRQVGKTYMIGWIAFALCSLIPGLTVIWTAHHTRTSNETFAKMKAMAHKKRAAAYVETVRSANGEQAIVFANESRILFGARDQGFGLGFDMVDILVLDEAQRVKEIAMADMVPATNAAPNGLVFLMGTPPRPTDNGDVFGSRRKDALAGDPDTLYIELSADPDAKIIDWDQVAKANPSYPHRTSRSAILRMQKLLGSDEGFYREGYGIWDDPLNAAVIPGGRWADALAGEDALRNPMVAVDLRTGIRQSLAIAVASIRSDETDDLDLAVYELGADEEWARDYAVSEVKRILADHALQYVTVDKYGEGNGLLIAQLEEAGVKVRTLQQPDMRSGAVGLVDAIVNGRVKHHNDEDLNASVAGAVKRKSGDGFLWDQSKASADLTPLRAVTAAWWALQVDRSSDYDVAQSYF